MSILIVFTVQKFHIHKF